MNNKLNTGESSIMTQDSDRKIEIGIALKSFNGTKE